MNALPSNEPSSRLIRDGRRVPEFRPGRPILVPAQCSQGRLHHPMSLQSRAPVAAAAVTFTATFMAR